MIKKVIDAAYRTDSAALLRLCFDVGGALAVLDTTIELQFIAACRCSGCGGAVSCMEELTQLGADPRMGVPAGWHNTPLIAASRAGSPRAVAWLCERGADVNATWRPHHSDGGGLTPLIAACNQGQWECAELLLYHNADIEQADSDGCTALMWAVYYPSVGPYHFNEQAPCVALLLDHGASGREQTQICPGEYMLCAASEAPTTDDGVTVMIGDHAVPRLIAAGAELEARDYDGYTPLLRAAERGRAGVVRALCACGADVRARTVPPVPAQECAGIIDRLGQTAVHIALLGGSRDWRWVEGYVASLDELVERGADLLAEDERGMNAFTSLWLDLSVRPQLPIKCPPAALLLARWPLGAPLPKLEVSDKLYMLSAALKVARRRVEVLQEGGRGDDADEQLKAAFQRRVRDACGCAVAPTYASFARFHFVESGGLERAAAWEREVHRFPVERVALCRAALQVAADALTPAAQLTIPLLKDLAEAPPSSAVDDCGGSRRREQEKQRYAAARCAGRWGTIRAAVLQAETDLHAAEATLDTAAAEAEEQAERLWKAVEAEEMRRRRLDLLPEVVGGDYIIDDEDD